MDKYNSQGITTVPFPSKIFEQAHRGPFPKDDSSSNNGDTVSTSSSAALFPMIIHQAIKVKRHRQLTDLCRLPLVRDGLGLIGV